MSAGLTEPLPSLLVPRLDHLESGALGSKTSSICRCLSLVDLGEGFGRGTAAAACAQGSGN